MVRHYDGYAHAHPPCRNDKCPVLRIPPGFFKNDVKIRYGYEENKENWVNINPLKKDYTTCNPNGTDYKVDIKNIPLFWKDKISEIDINPDFDTSQVRNAEAQRILDMISHAAPFIQMDLVNKIMKQYGY